MQKKINFQQINACYKIKLLCCVLYFLACYSLACSVLLEEFFPLCQVLRGADRNVDFLIKDSKNGVLDSHLWTSTGSTDKEIKKDGNLVYFSQIFIVTYNLRRVT